MKNKNEQNLNTEKKIPNETSKVDNKQTTAQKPDTASRQAFDKTRKQ